MNISQSDKIVTISDRGQITIPLKIREMLPVKHYVCEFNNGKLTLAPLQTRDDFLNELEESEKEWNKKGGASLKDLQKKYNL